MMASTAADELALCEQPSWLAPFAAAPASADAFVNIDSPFSATAASAVPVLQPGGTGLKLEDVVVQQGQQLLGSAGASQGRVGRQTRSI